MTCIVAYERNGTVWMGGDSAGVADYYITSRGDSKIFHNNGYLIGFTTSFRMGQLLRYQFNPSPCPDWDLEKHMCTTFINEVISCFSDNGYLKKSSESQTGGTFLVSYRGRIFKIGDDFNVGWNRVPYNSTGCGMEVALGAMYALNDTSCTPEMVITKALDAASSFSAGVCGPYTILRN